MSSDDKQRGIADAERARAELYGTLSQLRDRLNYAKRVDDAMDSAKRRIADEKQRNPLAFAAGVAGVAAAAGVVVWGIASRVVRRFQ